MEPPTGGAAERYARDAEMALVRAWAGDARTNLPATTVGADLREALIETRTHMLPKENM